MPQEPPRLEGKVAAVLTFHLEAKQTACANPHAAVYVSTLRYSESCVSIEKSVTVRGNLHGLIFLRKIGKLFITDGLSFHLTLRNCCCGYNCSYKS